MCSIITYRSTRSSTKALIRSGIMGSASSPSALCLNVTHQGANSASSPLPLRMMRPAQLQAFSSQILVGQQLQRRLQEGVRGARRNSPCAICREPGRSGHSWQRRDWHQQPERPQKAPKGPKRTPIHCRQQGWHWPPALPWPCPAPLPSPIWPIRWFPPARWAEPLADLANLSSFWQKCHPKGSY